MGCVQAVAAGLVGELIGAEAVDPVAVVKEDATLRGADETLLSSGAFVAAHCSLSAALLLRALNCGF